MRTFAEWCRTAERVPLAARGGETHQLSCRPGRGRGPQVTLLHGFPTSSFDWARVVEQLGQRVAPLTFDFLGFGDSDKPRPHRYAIHEQADLTEAVWAHYGVTETHLVAHDYAVSVAQELLARRAEGFLHVRIAGVLFLNGGLYPDLHRALPTQTALLDPVQGPVLSALITEETFAAGLAPTFPPGRAPAAAELHELWESIACRDGQRIAHELIRYIEDRRTHERRWVDALEHTDLPCRFVWGMLDPVSGAHMAARIRERQPDRRLVALEAVGHWPALEAPEAVVAEILAGL